MTIQLRPLLRLRKGVGREGGGVGGVCAGRDHQFCGLVGLVRGTTFLIFFSPSRLARALSLVIRAWLNKRLLCGIFILSVNSIV